MSYVKITNGAVAQYPYSTGQLRRDNANTSFPRNVPVEIMRRYGMKPVTVDAMPEYDALTQKVTSATTPTRNVVRLMTEADATDPITEEVNTDLVGTPIYGNDWVITRTVVDLTADEIATNDAATAVANRATRDALIATTDYFALTDVTMGDDMTTYRQALRDITSHVNWPNLEAADWPTKP
jgi:hypothetical protein